jgi:hypothetical protein
VTAARRVPRVAVEDALGGGARRAASSLRSVTSKGGRGTGKQAPVARRAMAIASAV